MAMLERASIDRRILARLLAAGVTLTGMAPLAAQTWDWTYALPAPPIDLAPVALSAPDANGFWALGRGLVHYRVDGTAQTVRNVDAETVALSVALSDGGVAFTNEPYPHGGPFSAPYGCAVTIYTARDEPLWTTTIPDGISYCTRLDVDGAGALWLQGSQASLYQLGRDGAVLGMVRSPAVADFVARNGAAGAKGVYLITTQPPARIIAVPQPGASEWTWTDAQATHQLQKLALGSDGNLYAAGRVAGAGSGALVVASVGPDGTQRFVQVSADIAVDSVLDVVPTVDGALYVIDMTAESIALRRVGSDGTVQWARASECSAASLYYYYHQSCLFSVTPQGDALVAAVERRELHRYDAAGAALVTALGANRALALAALPSGDALLAITNSQGDMRSFAQVRRDGTLAPAPATQRLLDSGYDRAQSALDAEGSTYLLATGRAQATSLAKVAADGTLNWRVEIAAGYQLAADRNGVCVLSTDGLSCFAAADGALRWSQAFHPVNSSALRALADGSIEVAGQEVINYVEYAAEQRVFDSAGNVLQQTPLPRDGAFPAIGPNGTLLLLTKDNQLLNAYDRNGVRQYQIAAPGQSQQGYYPPPVIDVGADGAALLSRNVAGDGEIAPFAWSITPQGAIRWSAKLRDGVGLYDPAGSVAGMAGNDGNVYFVLRTVPTPAVVPSYAVTVQARAADSGALRWERSDVMTDGNGSQLLRSTAGDRLLLLGRDARKLHTALLETAGGAVLRLGALPCPTDIPASGTQFSVSGCDWQGAALGADGALRIAAFVGNASNASAPYAFALRGALDVAPLLASQPGMDGAWFAPYESGQGFMLDYIPGAGVFMPWFTYADDDNGNDPSKLAWYVLQGGDCCDGSNGPPGIAFTIQRADPGTFAAGAVGVEKVGAARMEFHDCTAAVLSYVFDARGAVGRGRSGSIALLRLTPSTNPCQLDAARATPAQIANAPTDGFDARQSGSWFDPALGGQGLQFEIIPRGDGFDGLVFGAWFTFDPAGHADDDTHEHWFTLQGNLAHAAHGQTDLVIARTLGGSFDGQATGNTVRVGHAALTMQGCDRAGPDPQQRARLDYAFDAADAAHAFAALSGTLNLVKLGGCSGP